LKTGTSLSHDKVTIAKHTSHNIFMLKNHNRFMLLALEAIFNRLVNKDKNYAVFFSLLHSEIR